MRRQQGFIQKQPQSSSQVSKLINIFETKDSPVIGATPVQSWKSWSTLAGSVPRNLDSSLSRGLTRHGSISNVKPENGTGNVNAVDIASIEQAEDGLVTLSNTLGNVSNVTNGESGKRQYRSGSFKQIPCSENLKKRKLDDTSETAEISTFAHRSAKPPRRFGTSECKSVNEHGSRSIAQESLNKSLFSGNSNTCSVLQTETEDVNPASKRLTKKSSVRKSLKDNFLEMSGDKNPTPAVSLSRTTSEGVSLQPLPVIKTMKSDTAVGTKTVPAGNGLAGSALAHGDLTPSRTVSETQLRSLPDLDSMFSVSKLSSCVQSTPSKEQNQVQLQSPNLSKQMIGLSLCDTPFNPVTLEKSKSPNFVHLGFSQIGSPQLEKKSSKATLSKKKRNCSSTSRFRGTPLKARLTPLITKETKSCSALGEQEIASSPAIRLGTPYKVHSTPVHPVLQAYESDFALKKDNKLTPKKLSGQISGTPLKTVSKLLSKLKTKRQNIVGPQEELFF